MIPRGLPGEGNILVFDNGGWAGYGIPNPGSPTGRRNALRDYSRVIEFDPITFEIIWQYPATESGYAISMVGQKLYSALMSSSQRLPNGNTLITEGSQGRIFEITTKFEIVWEYINPYFNKKDKRNIVYRAYRVPYEWIPQTKPPKTKEIPPIDKQRFRVPGSLQHKVQKTTRLKI
jgi:outer membrane protein assembly factor BamB